MCWKRQNNLSQIKWMAVNWCKRSLILHMTGWGSWLLWNWAWKWKLTILSKGLYTKPNPSSKMNSGNSLKLWDQSRSTDPGQETRLSERKKKQKKKQEFAGSGFCRSSLPEWITYKGEGKRDEFLPENWKSWGTWGRRKIRGFWGQ